jgi:hypothetical protein
MAGRKGDAFPGLGAAGFGAVPEPGLVYSASRSARAEPAHTNAAAAARTQTLTHLIGFP